ncbi:MULTISPECIES: EF-hand domain-containing protein [Methylomicrobium]|uniref:EF-hand domain-containing protein n=1 Tax=Methylomicrobium album BG8 TaxID=686340 RepID=H8GNC3_METAL|nr:MULTISPECIES: EF-hand domain-containing protein [Methylomicrobium]EIC28352.1 hypothetical protein Metal_0501 [Methylomicrobium album BG8]
MRISNGLNKKSWLLIGFCVGLPGGAQAGAMGGADSISSQERTGSPSATSPEGTSGSTEGSGSSTGASGSSGSQGSSGTSRGTPGAPAGSSGTSGTSGGTSGTQQSGSSGLGSSQGMGKVRSFQSVDKNGDGYVTKNELADSPSLLKHFDRADTNKDAQLEENEYKKLIIENEQ